MTQYLIRRILVSIPVFFGVTLIVYALYALSPGDPVVNIVGLGAYQLMSAETIEKVRVNYGLDKPWYVRYGRWLGKALQGDLGYPLKGNGTVVDDWIRS